MPQASPRLGPAGESDTWNLILHLSFHCKIDELLGNLWSCGDFRDVPMLDALGAGTPGAGVAGVYTAMSCS